MELSLTDEWELPASNNTEREVMNTMGMQEILDAFGNLPKDVQLLLIMRFSLGLTFREIAKQTGFKLTTVAFRVGKGVEALRNMLAPGIGSAEASYEPRQFQMRPWAGPYLRMNLDSSSSSSLEPRSMAPVLSPNVRGNSSTKSH